MTSLLLLLGVGLPAAMADSDTAGALVDLRAADTPLLTTTDGRAIELNELGSRSAAQDIVLGTTAAGEAEMVRPYRSGTVEIVGWRKPVPAHEGYARFNDASSPTGDVGVTMFQRPNAGFVCLNGGACAYGDINVSVAY